MKTRSWKYLALAASAGGVMIVSGCGQMILESVFGNVASLIASAIITAVVANNT